MHRDGGIDNTSYRVANMMLYIRACHNIKADNAYVGKVKLTDIMNAALVMENVCAKTHIYIYIL